jgi:CheY-like chemotaxis protein
MAPEKFSIKVDSKFIENLFGLADMPPPANVELEDLNEIIDKIRVKLNNFALNTSGFNMSSADDQNEIGSNFSSNRQKNVLIADDLGIITYQLEMLFKKMGYQVVISQEINDAIDKFKKQDFGYAVIDLFIPTEREGFILLDELKKLALLCKLNTRIIVMTATSKPEYQTKCMNRGADFYVEKSPGWQKKIIEACLSK